MGGVAKLRGERLQEVTAGHDTDHGSRSYLSFGVTVLLTSRLQGSFTVATLSRNLNQTNHTEKKNRHRAC